jgi:hypothetical protein
MSIPIVAGGGLAIGLSKRASNRRKQAAANEYSKKYPLLDDVGAMDSSITAAVNELKNIDAVPAKTAGAKRVKKRNSDTLRSWLLVMKEHAKDLSVGMNLATTQVTNSAGELPIKQDVLYSPPQFNKDALSNATVLNSNQSANLAEGTQKKGVNWLLIGGFIVAGFIVYKIVKKN